MSVALYAEDPGARDIHEADVRRTLAHLAAHPDRGLALVVTDGDEPVGYMILIAFWSNELGGLCAIVDELFMIPAARGRGLGAAALEAVAAGRVPGFEDVVAVDLEVTPDNARARALYSRLGFRPQKNGGMRRRLA
ncbi:MAG: GNAT family N-acetyltransferase [Deltaproteobacteria bacterium]|nr:GNAT family N-acetyltransferase [Deltaproteobacteria bacterium]